MSHSIVDPGEAVLIWGQLSDGAASLPKYLRAEIYDHTNALLATKDLVSRGDGFFSDNTFIMPLALHVRAEIKVYSDPLYSVLDETYDVITDVFYPGKTQQIVGLLTNFTPKGSAIVVDIKKTPRLQASLVSNELQVDVNIKNT